MVSSRRCFMECWSRRLAFFGVAFAGVAAALSLAINTAADARELTEEEVVHGDGVGEGDDTGCARRFGDCGRAAGAVGGPGLPCGWRAGPMGEKERVTGSPSLVGDACATPLAPLMASKDAHMEVERWLRDIDARFGSLPSADEELLQLIELWKKYQKLGAARMALWNAVKLLQGENGMLLKERSELSKGT
ncbi:hypothetical protein ABZP36_004389 [Zizania latifolia]